MITLAIFEAGDIVKSDIGMPIKIVKFLAAGGQGEVYAIASRTVEKAKEAANRLNIDVYYGSYEELFEEIMSYKKGQLPEAKIHICICKRMNF